MKYAISKRASSMKPFMVMTLLESALKMEAEGKSITHFEIGEPDFDSPDTVKEAAIEAIRGNLTHYTHSRGELLLRKKIAEYKKKSRGIDVDPEREIIVSAGSSPAFLLALAALLEPGDEVIFSDPGYPCYINFINFFGAKPVPVKVFEEDAFDFDIDRLKEAITPKTKVLILNSPSNPTGQIISMKNLERIADLANEYDFYIISDEIYAELVYSDKIAPSISEIKSVRDRVIVIDGFSKYWAMTGWRLGYLIASEPLIKAMNVINQNFLICAPSISQMAGIAALDELTRKSTENMLAMYRKRREVMLKRIGEIEGFSIVPPKGAFYAFVNISNITRDSERFAWDLLEQGHVAATPGIAFGENGEGFIRFSYCTDVNDINEGFDKIESFLKKYVSK